MANSDNYRFGLDIDIEKAMRSLSKVDRAVDRLSNKKTNNNDQLNQNEYNNIAREVNKVSESFKALQGELRDTSRYANSMEDAFGMAKATKGLKTMESQLQRVQQQYRQLGRNTGLNQSSQYDRTRFVAGQQRNNFQGIGKDSLKGMRENYTGFSSRVSRVQGDAQRLKTNIQTGGYLNGNDFKKLMSTMNHLNNFGGHMTDKNKQDISKREAKLGQVNSGIQDLQSRKQLSEAQRKELNAKIEEANTIYEEIKILEKFQRTLDKTTATLEDLERVSGISRDIATTAENKTLQHVKPERGTAMGTAYERAPSIAMALVGGSMAVLASRYNQGGSIKDGLRDDNLSIGTQTGNFNYHSLRKQQEANGLADDVGMSGTEMLRAQAEYMDKAGFQGNKDLDSVAKETGRFSRGLGVTVADSTNNTAVMAQYMNGANSSTIKEMQNAFAGGLKASGMVGQNKQQLSALDTLVSTVGSTTSLSKEDMTQLIGMQSVFASTGTKSMQGDQGAKLISDMNAGIQGSTGNAFAFSMAQRANPERYATGVNGFNQYMYDAMEGTQGELFPALMKSGISIVNSQGGSEEQQAGSLANYIQQTMGVQMTADQSKSMLKLQRDGSLNSESIKEVMSSNAKSGKEEIDSNSEKYGKSDVATETQYTNAIAKQATAVNDSTTALKSMILPVTMATGGFGVLISMLGAFGVALAGVTAQMALAGGIKGGISSASGSAKKGKAKGVVGKTKSFLGGFFGGGGGASTATSTASQATSRVARNAGSGGLGGAVKGVASKVPVLGTLVTGGLMASSIHSINKADSQGGVTDKEHKEKLGGTIGSGTGGIAGGIAGGALAGGAIGSVVPVAGTAVGSIVGGIGGAIAGSSLGGWLGKKVGGWFGSDEKESSVSKKEDEETTAKKQSAEEKRSQNIAKDAQFVKEYKDAMNGGAVGGASATRQGVDSPTASESTASTTDSSNTAVTTEPTNTSSSGSGTVNVKIKHEGEVSTIAKGGDELIGRTNNALSNLGLKSQLPNGNQYSLG